MGIGTPIEFGRFVSDGRGPSLHRVHWDRSGTVLRAIDYHNPGDPHDAAHLKHLRFTALQVVCITPEEVIGSDALGDLLAEYPGAAAFDRGRSQWLTSFASQHLSKCQHYQFLFYDELVEVIAEGVEAYGGGYHEAVELTAGLPQPCGSELSPLE